MRILFISPPRSPKNAIYDHASEEIKKVVHRKLIGPPLGLITIAASVKDLHETFVLDLKGECDLHNDKVDYIQIVKEWLRKVNPDIVAVSFIVSELPYGLHIFKIAKQFNPHIITIAGGLHVSLCPNHFDTPEVDIACKGQAAKTFVTIVSAISNNKELHSISGINFQKGEKSGTAIFDTIQYDAAQEHFILPYRKALKPWLSTYKVGNGEGPVTYIFTSLGCPYKCTFCSIWPQFEGRYYQRTIKSIIDELKTLDDYPAVRFADANTIVNTNFISQLFDEIHREGIKKSFIMDIRADTAAQNPQLIEKCARGGLKVVISGFESFRDDELSKYNKNSPSSFIENAIKIFHDNGIMIRGNYVIPPGYTEKDFDALSEFAGRFPVAYAGYTILTPMPGTVLYNKEFDNIIDHDLTKYNFFNCVMKTALPLEKFYRQVSDLWKIRKGKDVI